MLVGERLREHAEAIAQRGQDNLAEVGGLGVELAEPVVEQVQPHLAAMGRIPEVAPQRLLVVDAGVEAGGREERHAAPDERFEGRLDGGRGLDDDRGLAFAGGLGALGGRRDDRRLLLVGPVLPVDLALGGLGGGRGWGLAGLRWAVGRLGGLVGEVVAHELLLGHAREHLDHRLDAVGVALGGPVVHPGLAGAEALVDLVPLAEVVRALGHHDEPELPAELEEGDEAQGEPVRPVEPLDRRVQVAVDLLALEDGLVAVANGMEARVEAQAPRAGLERVVRRVEPGAVVVGHDWPEDVAQGGQGRGDGHHRERIVGVGGGGWGGLRQEQIPVLDEIEALRHGVDVCANL